MVNVFTRAPHTPSFRAISSRMLEAEDDAAALNNPQHAHDHDASSSSSYFANNNDSAAAAAAAGAAAPIMERLVARDLPYHQSSNSLRVRHQMSKKTKNSAAGLRFFHWYIEDWFHVLLRLRTIVSALLLVMIWTGILLLFAGIYVAIDNQNPKVDCGLGASGSPIRFNGAFAFSLETATTVGYGLPNGVNGFFENCPALQVAIYFQMLLSMFFNAFLLSFIFARVSRSEARAAQVLFSNKAIIHREVLPSGIVRYMLSTRIYDADSMYPIVEAHVRFYAVKHRTMHLEENSDVRQPMRMEPMRVSMPNDDLGAVLYTSIPTCATHHIDYHSPIQPPSTRRLGPEDGRVPRTSGFVRDSCGMGLRENDSYTGSNDGLQCVVCGETYGTVVNLIQHIRYNQHTEKHDEVPVLGSHQELDVEALFSKKIKNRITGGNANETVEVASDQHVSKDAIIDIDEPRSPWYDEYQNYLRESNTEIICVMEAIDPIMSGTFQAIQSYTINDIVFDVEFSPCVLADRDEGRNNFGWLKRMFVGRSAVGRSIKIDLDSFHKTVKFDK